MDQLNMSQKKDPVSKVFTDPVHGQIELHPLCVKIIDTPEFQRMRFIRQLGPCLFLYHGASHSRFEHCIGVCHLAGKLVEAITARQEDKVSDKKRLCVKIAGLCHDLGHGPFSHMFEKVVKKGPNKKWKHEEASQKLIDRIYKHLKTEFKDLGDLEAEDVEFIKELIHPSEELYDKVKNGGDEQKKKDFFLYEIVANETYKVDVDKWDYFARDSLYLGVKNSFDHDRLIASARACVDTDGVSHVTYRDKDVDNLYEMFHIRFTLHRKAYQHRLNKAVEMMIGDAMELADDIRVMGDDEKPKMIHEAVDDMGAYIKLNDDVLHRIAESSSERARTLVARIYTRDIYTYIGEKTIKVKMTEEAVIDEIIMKEKWEGKEKERDDMKQLLGVDIASYDYGNKDKNPVLNAYFYTKEDKQNAVHLDEKIFGRRMMVPMQFNETVARVFCKSTETGHKDSLKEMTKRWSQPKDGLGTDGE
ncbi:deoxynucleoside triphosphate triphosphohydrolase SAMHD1-like isoform X3 [Pecten maximus]|uniref:deoxynucleoside triphosphate triphosphohydrolase SAMHD1-like isoform X2 n=1 Tax=Pecten maximus TaxID=6579 RepID=UPI0014582A3A|nr:deoxynucleoside triphosphate triphosphohydrolase SAMHD1-like isoform X2 [Pecten maximus]XP_033728035.1 deoxynucleoside triphosphate triphosphohydrolase SAMHD1-like isoform X3 [Pecten maximus]